MGERAGEGSSAESFDEPRSTARDLVGDKTGEAFTISRFFTISRSLLYPGLNRILLYPGSRKGRFPLHGTPPKRYRAGKPGHSKLRVAGGGLRGGYPFRGWAVVGFSRL